jgi:putative hemolysin
MPGELFDLNTPSTTPMRRAAFVAARPLLRWVLCSSAFEALYALTDSKASFAAGALDVLDARRDCTDIANVPASGPVIVAANHPHGALDGLVLLDLVGRRRGDVRLLANHLLRRVTPLRDHCFFVDPFDRAGAPERSLGGLRAAHLWLRQGGVLMAFPSGEVAHQVDNRGLLVDAPWRDTVGRLALATGARVVPAWISGGNSRLFRAAGRLHPWLRTALLPRELLKARGRVVHVTLGEPVLYARDAFGEDAPQRSVLAEANAVTLRIRDAVERLAEAPLPARTRSAALAMSVEVNRLPASSCLISAGEMRVYCAGAEALPTILPEIGRLREVSYRAVGEGTGHALDLDRFDAHYLHLFVWNATRHEIVGAYRLAPTDRVVGSMGVAGLYTRTLFRYDRALIDRLGPSVELGRSFVRPEYQRNHAALLLLWRGVCAFIARHPHYRRLFGAVSISSRYADQTRELLMSFLEQNHRDDALAELVSAVTPYEASRPRTAEYADVPRTADEAEAMVTRLSEQGMPVLLRHYLKLNARLLGFNVDPSFGDALDALMAVDLLAVEARLLRRYFGHAEADAYLAVHRAAIQAA